MGASAESDHLLTPFLLKGPNGCLPLRRGTCAAHLQGSAWRRVASEAGVSGPATCAAQARGPRAPSS